MDNEVIFSGKDSSNGEAILIYSIYSANGSLDITAKSNNNQTI